MPVWEAEVPVQAAEVPVQEAEVPVREAEMGLALVLRSGISVAVPQCGTWRLWLG